MTERVLSQETVQDDVARLRHLLDAALNDLQSSPPDMVGHQTINRVAALIEIARDMARDASHHLLEDFGALAKDAAEARS